MSIEGLEVLPSVCLRRRSIVLKALLIMWLTCKEHSQRYSQRISAGNGHPTLGFGHLDFFQQEGKHEI